jgi:hypothetical protein
MDEHHDLQMLLGQIAAACEEHAGGSVSVGDMLQTLGDRSFGPLLLVPGLIGLSPIGAIPGVPAVMAVIVMLVSGQILVGRDHAWIPAGLARRSIEAARLKRAIDVIEPWARLVDKFLRPRLTFFTRGIFFYVLTAVCLVVALVTPLIELVPLAGIVPNAAIVSFGLALTARDGLWALIALGFTGASAYLIFLAV